MGLLRFIVLGRPVSRIRLTTSMGHPGTLALVTSVLVPVRHIPNSSPRKASSSSTVGFCLLAMCCPGNSSSVVRLGAFPETCSLQTMPNSFADPCTPAYYVGKTLECVLTCVRRFDRFVRPGRVSGVASLNAGLVSVFLA